MTFKKRLKKKKFGVMKSAVIPTFFVLLGKVRVLGMFIPHI